MYLDLDSTTQHPKGKKLCALCHLTWSNQSDFPVEEAGAKANDPSREGRDKWWPSDKVRFFLAAMEQGHISWRHPYPKIILPRKISVLSNILSLYLTVMIYIGLELINPNLQLI